MMSKIVLFDGECTVCNKSVQFIIKRDPAQKFQFASLQSDSGRNLLTKYNVPHDINSIVLIDDNDYYVKSTAVLRICRHLNSFLKYAFIFLIVPKQVRDFCYTIIAKNRHKFSRSNSNHCSIPSVEDRKRFL